MTGMPDDISLDTFVDTLRRSKLFDAADVGRLATQSRSTSARAFADTLIRSGELTRYQAHKLLRGRWQGLVLGPYNILAPLGRGGMGTVVYLARDRRVSESLGDNDLVALKVLPDRKALDDPKTLARFRREMELQTGHCLRFQESTVSHSARSEHFVARWLSLECRQKSDSRCEPRQRCRSVSWRTCVVRFLVPRIHGKLGVCSAESATGRWTNLGAPIIAATLLTTTTAQTDAARLTFFRVVAVP